MRFASIVKGQLTQSLIKALFERAGYRVTRFGIEELFYEIVRLEKEQYLQLGLPKQLRYLPDLLIATPEVTSAFLVEVKFRRSFNQQTSSELYHILRRQFSYWPSARCVLLISEPCSQGGRFHQDYIRVIDSDHLLHLDSSIWSKDSTIDQAFQSPRHVIQSSYKVHGCDGVWGLLPALNSAFELFGHRTTDTWKYADMITSTLKDLGKL